MVEKWEITLKLEIFILNGFQTHRDAFKSQLPQTTKSIENKENGKRASKTWYKCRCRKKKMSIQNMCNSNSTWFCIFWYSHLWLVEVHRCGKRKKKGFLLGENWIRYRKFVHQEFRKKPSINFPPSTSNTRLILIGGGRMFRANSTLASDTRELV